MKKGFTLIELLVVVAIIGVLSSIVLSSLSDVRARARDTRRIADFRNMKVAMELYFSTHGNYPPSPQYSASLCSTGNNNSHEETFEAVTQALVDDGFLPVVPEDPGDGCYAMYDYGAGNNIGQIFVTRLETLDPTTEAPYNSCRPFTNNWCSSTLASNYYCDCYPY
jgi:prepilin-type N-terminal cleavage/methylation domain-containing protein